jgi:predicted transcriptional regulator
MKQDCLQTMEITSMTAEIAAAFVGHNTVKANEVPALIKAIYRSLEHADERTSETKSPQNQPFPMAIWQPHAVSGALPVGR